MPVKKKKKTPVLEDVISVDIKEELKGGLDPAPNRIKDVIEGGGLVARLETVNDDLRSVSGIVFDNLMSIMKSNEELTRETFLSQVEIKRAEELKASLEKNLYDYKANLKILTKETEKLDVEVSEFNVNIKDFEAQKKTLLKSKSKLDINVKDLTSECTVLADENNKLKIKKDKLAGEVASLKKIREEYLAQISRFKEMKDDLLT